MTVVSNEDGIIMIEAGAKEIDEEQVLEGLTLAHETNQRMIRAQKELYAGLGHQEARVHAQGRRRGQAGPGRARARARAPRGHAGPRQEGQRGRPQGGPRSRHGRRSPRTSPRRSWSSRTCFNKLEEKLFRELVLQGKLRTDGRGFDDIRPITSEVGLLTRTHGSALFTRGETQALATVTLGTFDDAQRLDSLRRGDQEAVHAPL